MVLDQLVDFVGATSLKLNVVKVKPHAVSSATLSSVIDSLTEIAGELKNVRRKPEADLGPSVYPLTN